MSGNAALPAADPDGDGLANIFESYFGRDLYVPETKPPVTISVGREGGQPVVVLEFDRAAYGTALGVRVKSSQDLAAWRIASDLVEQIQPLGPLTEHVRLVDAGNLPARFFRIEVSGPAGGKAD